MDEDYLLAAARYIELNPVKAGLVKSPGDYHWSSARHYLGEHEDPLLAPSPLSHLVDDWADFLSSVGDVRHNEHIRRAERSGRPLGSDVFIATIEKTLNRQLRRSKPGPKKAIK
jgi:putative transposase